jgi:rubredoxin
MSKYKCQNCGFGFDSKSELDKKNAKDHKGKDYVCNECGYIIGAVNPSTVKDVPV